LTALPALPAATPSDVGPPSSNAGGLAYATYVRTPSFIALLTRAITTTDFGSSSGRWYRYR
jgi:hypothetical protein